MTAALILLVTFLLGVALQHVPTYERLREVVWLMYFWTVSPVLVYAVFRTVHVDRKLLLALGAAIAATWLLAAAAYGYALLVSRRRDERGALALAASCPNTGFLGYPVAQLVFGAPGLSLAVVYDQFSWLVPATSVTTTVARLHGRRRVDVGRERPLRAMLLNPPLLGMAVALACRAFGWEIPGTNALRHLTAALVGPVGFFLLGLALPLERPVYEPAELRRAAGALMLRFAGGPVALLAAGRAFGVGVPGVFYLLSAMPSAFHLLILARVYELRPALMRLLVVGSTVPAVAAVMLVAGLH